MGRTQPGIALGAIFPGYEVGSDPSAIRDYAQAAEELGYERMVAYDHVLGFEGADQGERGFYEETVEFHEPLTLFSYLAALTERIRFTTGILILPTRPTALVAKQAAEVAILSGSRLELGVGLGSTPVEYEALGADIARRGARIEEQVELLRALWHDPLVDFAGDFHRIDRGAMLPKPPGAIPILMGGASEAAYRRAARVADGFILMASSRPFHEGAERLAELVVEAGRSLDDFAVHAVVDLGIGESAAAEEIVRWRQFGAASVCVRTSDRDASLFGAPTAGLRTPAEHIAALERFATLATA
jgi:probable F420-dependent oxidoreductase